MKRLLLDYYQFNHNGQLIEVVGWLKPDHMSEEAFVGWMIGNKTPVWLIIYDDQIHS
jgi:hypothetical protein